MDYTLFSLYGKTCPVHYLQIGDWTFALSLKRSQKLKFQCLDLENGQTPEWFEGTGEAWHTESWAPNFGESPSAAVESSLSQILLDSVPQKYYLSPRACVGILRRATERGRIIPEELSDALNAQIKHYSRITPLTKESQVRSM